MKRVKSFSELNNYIAQFIDGDSKQGLSFSGKELHTDGDKMFWRNKELMTEVEIDSLSALLDGLNFVKSIAYDENNGEITVTNRNDTFFKIRVPVLDIIDNIDYDETEKELVLIKKDETELRIDLSDLIDIYTGSEGAEIEIEVVGNQIRAVLLPGTVTEEHLLSSLAAKIAKIEPLVEKVAEIETAFDVHNHDGENSEKVSYGNLVDRPIVQHKGENVSDSFSINAGADIFNAEYVAKRGSLRQSGTLKVCGSDIIEINVVGDDVGVSFSISGNVLTAQNTDTPSGSIDVLFLVSQF